MLVPYSAIELGSEVVQWPPFLLASKVREISGCEQSSRRFVRLYLRLCSSTIVSEVAKFEKQSCCTGSGHGFSTSDLSRMSVQNLPKESLQKWKSWH
jgi:hypothetical protein